MEAHLSQSKDRFADEPHNRGRGRAAEVAAVKWLASKGYEILRRNVVTLAGEIDVIADDQGTLCFIEVKARTSDLYGPAIAAVDRRKQRRLVRCAALYLAEARVGEVAIRFDVLGLEAKGRDWRFTLVQNAFEASSLLLV